MAKDYDKTAASALRMLANAGAACTITRQGVGQGGYNPDTGTFDPAPAPLVQTGTAAVFPYPEKLIDGTTVLRGDHKAYVAPQLDWAPRATDTMTWQGKGYTVISVDTLAPAGRVVLYTLQVRA